jgi:hypothetical protein
VAGDLYGDGLLLAEFIGDFIGDVLPAIVVVGDFTVLMDVGRGFVEPALGLSDAAGFVLGAAGLVDGRAF